MAAVGKPLKIAVVGGGISGIVAAYVLSKKHEVTIFEKNGYLGGHTNTIVVENEHDARLPVDTGFIVCNPRNYPNFYKFLDQLSVHRQDSCMSFGFSCENTGLQYMGPGFQEFLRTPKNFLSPYFLRMALDQRRFCKRALIDIEQAALSELSVGDYLDRLGLSRYFAENYLIPLAASIWSSPDTNVLSFPLTTLVRFFRNHGILELGRRIPWQTVKGGSHTYVKAFLDRFNGKVRLNCSAVKVSRYESFVTVALSDGNIERFDKVVFGTHADETLRMLNDPSKEESLLLGSWRYHRNRTVLHTYPGVLAPKRKLWASWNYVRRTNRNKQDGVEITYYMNLLQQFNSRNDYFVTLNSSIDIPRASVIYETTYTHPEYTHESVKSQKGVSDLNGRLNTYYCGSYLGYGFHEDGVRSALNVTSSFGLSL